MYTDNKSTWNLLIAPHSSTHRGLQLSVQSTLKSLVLEIRFSSHWLLLLGDTFFCTPIRNHSPNIVLDHCRYLQLGVSLEALLTSRILPLRIVKVSRSAGSVLGHNGGLFLLLGGHGNRWVLVEATRARGTRQLVRGVHQQSHRTAAAARGHSSQRLRCLSGVGATLVHGLSGARNALVHEASVGDAAQVELLLQPLLSTVETSYATAAAREGGKHFTLEQHVSQGHGARHQRRPQKHQHGAHQNCLARFHHHFAASAYFTDAFMRLARGF